jgi:two-component system NtrC family response regulator
MTAFSSPRSGATGAGGSRSAGDRPAVAQTIPGRGTRCSPGDGLAPGRHLPDYAQVYREIGLAAANDIPVIIAGESVTGKELIARPLHEQSNREQRSTDFIPI